METKGSRKCFYLKKNNEKENTMWEEAIMDTLGSGWWGRWAISEGAKKNPNICK